MLIFWKERPQGVSHFLIDLILSGVKVGLVLKWIEYIPLKEASIVLQIGRGYIISLVISLLCLHVSLCLILITCKR
jgi:polyferredoxin